MAGCVSIRPVPKPPKGVCNKSLSKWYSVTPNKFRQSLQGRLAAKSLFKAFSGQKRCERVFSACDSKSLFTLQDRPVGVGPKVSQSLAKIQSAAHNVALKHNNGLKCRSMNMLVNPMQVMQAMQAMPVNHRSINICIYVF